MGGRSERGTGPVPLSRGVSQVQSGAIQMQMWAEAGWGILAEEALGGECAAPRNSRPTLSLLSGKNRKRSQPPTSAPRPSILKPKSATLNPQPKPNPVPVQMWAGMRLVPVQSAKG